MKINKNTKKENVPRVFNKDNMQQLFSFISHHQVTIVS